MKTLSITENVFDKRGRRRLLGYGRRRKNGKGDSSPLGGVEG